MACRCEMRAQCRAGGDACRLVREGHPLQPLSKRTGGGGGGGAVLRSQSRRRRRSGHHAPAAPMLDLLSILAGLMVGASVVGEQLSMDWRADRVRRRRRVRRGDCWFLMIP
eukprot:SAG31_NODE_10_length_40133_cov_27.863041_29_plen_111_part_00